MLEDKIFFGNAKLIHSASLFWIFFFWDKSLLDFLMDNETEKQGVYVNGTTQTKSFVLKEKVFQ